MLPHVLGDTTLEWRNDSMVTCHCKELDHWQSRQRVGIVSGGVWPRYAEWVAAYTAAHPGYQMFDVWSATDLHATRWIDGCKCDEFAASSFEYLYELGGITDVTKKTLYRNYVPLISAAPPEVSLSMSSKSAVVAILVAVASPPPPPHRRRRRRRRRHWLIVVN